MVQNLQGSFLLRILPLMQKERIRRISWLSSRGIKAQKCISINSPIRWKSKFETEVCSCSSFPTDAMLSIKEVEMVVSVDDLRTSQSIGGHRFPNFEILDAKIASALKITSNPILQEESQSAAAKGPNG